MRDLLGGIALMCGGGACVWWGFGGWMMFRRRRTASGLEMWPRSLRLPAGLPSWPETARGGARLVLALLCSFALIFVGVGYVIGAL